MKALKQHLGSMVRGLVLSIAAGCAYTPPFQPKDDYAQYPGYEKDIALHNIAGILKTSCEEYSVSHQGIYCKTRDCPGGLVREQRSGVMTYCSGGWNEVESRFGWEEVGEIEIGGRGCVMVKDTSGTSHLGNNPLGCTFYVFMKGDDEHLKKAIEQYVAHR